MRFDEDDSWRYPPSLRRVRQLPRNGRLALILVAVAIYTGFIFGMQLTSLGWYWGPIAISLFAGNFFHLIVILGFVWSPFAAFICSKIAVQRGLNPWRYALGGALYSSLSLYLWFTLIAAMQDRPFSISQIRYPLYILFILWVLGPITEFTIFSRIKLPYDENIYGWVYLSLWLLLLLLFAVSLSSLLNILEESGSDEHLTPRIPIPEWRPALPFLGLTISGLIMISRFFWPD